eukprot:m.221404 g.221404  ORF g.221404 m.221404 type:complete len:61 (+) comp15788_c0_seq1:32-214(+)
MAGGHDHHHAAEGAEKGLAGIFSVHTIPGRRNIVVGVLSFWAGVIYLATSGDKKAAPKKH